jgi:predicted ATPase/class 3 adenylate cyclase/Tfp pilus assembly protein PilF
VDVPARGSYTRSVDEPATSRRDLPTGTVTLVFTDVEGSTRLLHLLGERFEPVRARMREVVRRAAAARGGTEVDWAGDGAFLAFSKARDALAAVVEIQRALTVGPSPSEEALRLRVGIHTGEPALGDEGYVGMDVVVAARICAAAHGEQTVVSRATRDMAGDEPVPDASYRPLGRHRLKDVPGAVQLFQLVAQGLRDDFPPLRTLSATSLPALHHRLVGRAEEAARIESLLGEPGVRLVTITGPGGAGKSRLALEVAASAALDRPVHLVGLAPVTDPDLVPNAIARAIGVREPADRPLLAAVAESLNGTSALLYLDNFEHLAPAAIHVARLLDGAPDLDVLATSRAPLRLSTERVLPLEPLSVEDATTLFLELAAARGVILREDALASVREICRRLDGLPLAIELVAARLSVLPPAEILRALGEGLALEMEGPVDLPERQRTLRAAIDWSYGRLTSSQRELHGAIAVFADGAALDDARAIAGAGKEFLPDLEALVGWSLVRSEATDGELRLSMLETVREHALDCLQTAGKLDELRQRHADRFLELALNAESELAGPEQSKWLGRLELEFDNIGAALDWLLSVGRVEDALRAISAAERFWRGHAHVAEARRWLSLGLTHTDDVAPDVRAAALRTASLQAAAQSDWPTAESMLSEARALYQTRGEKREEVLALSYLSFFATRQNDIVLAERYAQEAVTIADELDDDRAASGALSALAEVYSAQGEHELAVGRYEEAAALRARLDDPLLLTDAVYSLGKAAFHAADLTRARQELERALGQARGLREAPYVAAAQLVLALIELRERDAASATERAGEALDLYSDLEDDRSRARCILILAAAASEQGDVEHAARLTGAAHALRGDEPPDEFESPVLERYLPILERRLGREALDELSDEGRSAGLSGLERVVVAADTEA